MNDVTSLEARRCNRSFLWTLLVAMFAQRIGVGVNREANVSVAVLLLFSKAIMPVKRRESLVLRMGNLKENSHTTKQGGIHVARS